MGDALAEEVVGGVCGREEDPRDKESNFNMSACE